MKLPDDAIGWALFHSLWEGAIVAAALTITLAAIRSPRARYVAACSALILMLSAFLVTMVYAMPDSFEGSHTARVTRIGAWIGDTVAGSENPSRTSLARVIPWLAPFWLAGVLAFGVRHIAGWAALRRLRRSGVCAASEFWQHELDRLATRLRVSKPVLLLESCLADTPMVLGHLRPTILIPIGLLTGWPADQVEAILLHELEHIRRCDYLVNLCQRIAEGLLFYHPAVWWIARVIRTEREHCCDDAVVAMSGDARGYAVTLAALELSRGFGREPAVAATGGSLVKRIRRLLYPRGPSGPWTSLLAAVILMAAAAMAVVAWQPTAQSPYEKWLNVDVVYLIDDAERVAFQKLTSDAERDMFIQQFWLRRDPRPGTPANEFKDESYRRLGYVNEHFGSWRSDRGRIYIRYGPPDEMESHPRVENWKYRHIEGMGDHLYLSFVDPNGTGDYKLLK